MNTTNPSVKFLNMKNRLIPLLATGGLLLLPGCSLPKLETAAPSRKLPSSYGTSTEPGSSAKLGWEEFFHDADLKKLIRVALTGNQELKILAQEVRMAGNEVQARQGEFLPSFDLRAGAGLEKASRNTRDGVVEESHDIREGRSFPDPLPDFLVSADVSWEVDLWKKLRNARKAAALRFLASREGQNFVVTRLVSEVAEAYYELLALDSRLEALDQTIEIQKQSLKIAEAEKEAARGTELAVQRFQAEVRKNESERLLIQQEIVEVENRLNQLAGRFPESIDRSGVDFGEVALRKLKVGVPAELLRNRSDIRQAELELAAADLDVKVARARFFPSLELTAGLGYQAFNARYLTSSPESLVYGAAGELVAPVLNRKAIKAEYLSANAEQLQKVYQYQQTVIKATTEVVNHLSQIKNYSKSVALKRQQLASLEASVESATRLFQNARVEYMEVLLAQRDMMEARVELIEARRKELTAIVQTYQALGGGGRPLWTKP